LLEVSAQEKSNSILFAGKGKPLSIDALRLSNRLKDFDEEVQLQLQREFTRISWDVTSPA
jgi:hypothetical protein